MQNKMNLDIDPMSQILIQVDDVQAHLVFHLCLTVCNPNGLYIAHQTPLVHGIFQAEYLEWVAFQKQITGQT